MKFLHTGDLHIGKKLFEASVLEDQAHILNQIHEIALAEQVQAVVLAGDLYDRSVPPAEAVTLLDVNEPYLMQIGFLTRTPRGRCVTPAACAHLGLPVPSRLRDDVEGLQLKLE